MAKAKTGALVMFCGHRGYFVADIYKVGTANVVRASGPVTPGNIIRKDLEKATHHVVDAPDGGFWRPDLGVMVVPESQCMELKK